MIFIQSVHNNVQFLIIMLTKLFFLALKCYRCCLRIYRTPLVLVFFTSHLKDFSSTQEIVDLIIVDNMKSISYLGNTQ